MTTNESCGGSRRRESRAKCECLLAKTSCYNLFATLFIRTAAVSLNRNDRMGAATRDAAAAHTRREREMKNDNTNVRERGGYIIALLAIYTEKADISVR